MTTEPDAAAAHDARTRASPEDCDEPFVEEVRAGLLACLPSGRALLALDVGAGPGREAASLAGLGHKVVAVEPFAAIRPQAPVRHPTARIRRVDDRLSDLGTVHGLGLAFDVVLLRSVWTHVNPSVRPRALRKVVTLLKPSGVIHAGVAGRQPAPEARPPTLRLGPRRSEDRHRGVVVRGLAERPGPQGPI